MRIAIRLTEDVNLQGELRRLVALLQEDVSFITVDRYVLKQLERENNKLITAYKPSVDIIRMLFQSEGTSLDEGDPQIQLQGFLFDMNRFFQELLSRFLTENLSNATVLEQYRLTDMLSYLPHYNPQGRRAPVLRPDFVIEGDDRATSILDAKYRDLWGNQLPPSMLYQLGMYALSEKSGMKAAIFYPTIKKDSREQIIEITDPYGRDRAQIILRPVNLLYLEKLISNLDENEWSTKASTFAHWLVYGEDLSTN